MSKFLTLLIITSIYLQGCSQGDSTTELEGSWSGRCYQGLYNFNGSTNTSFNLTIKFSYNNIFTYVNEYSDDACSLLESSVRADQSDLIINGYEWLAFKLGKEIIASDGVNIMEIDFITSDGEVYKDIYLLQNNNTLYFGTPCDFAAACVNGRSHEISYGNPFIRNN